MRFRNLLEYAKIGYGALQILNIVEDTIHERDHIHGMREAAYRKVLEGMRLDESEIPDPGSVYGILAPYEEILYYLRTRDNWQNSLRNDVVFGFSAALIVSGIYNLAKNLREDKN